MKWKMRRCLRLLVVIEAMVETVAIALEVDSAVVDSVRDMPVGMRKFM